MLKLLSNICLLLLPTNRLELHILTETNQHPPPSTHTLLIITTVFLCCTLQQILRVPVQTGVCFNHTRAKTTIRLLVNVKTRHVHVSCALPLFSLGLCHFKKIFQALLAKWTETRIKILQQSYAAVGCGSGSKGRHSLSVLGGTAIAVLIALQTSEDFCTLHVFPMWFTHKDLKEKQLNLTNLEFTSCVFILDLCHWAVEPDKLRVYLLCVHT